MDLHHELCTCSCRTCKCICHKKPEDWFESKCHDTKCTKHIEEHQLHCLACNSNVTPSGNNSKNRLISRHLESSVNHVTAVRELISSGNQFHQKLLVDDVIFTNYEKSAISQGAYAYHNDFHSIPSRVMNCFRDLTKELYDDLFNCGADKNRLICDEIFAPYSDDKLQSELDEAICVSVYSDCTNHKELKMHGIPIRFYTPEQGLKHRLLDLDRVPGESAPILATSILKAIKQFGIESKIIAVSCDSAPTNFGGKHRCDAEFEKGLNLHKHLQRQMDCLIVGEACPCHLLNNSCQTGAADLPIDIPTILRLLYEHFQGSTTRCQELAAEEARAFEIELIAQDLEKIIDQIVPKSYTKTRWLSMHPAIRRLVTFFRSYAKYFESPRLNGSKDIDKIREFFRNKTSLAWLMIVETLSLIYHKKILIMEADDATLPRVVTEVNSLKIKLIKLTKITQKSLHKDIILEQKNWSAAEKRDFLKKVKELYNRCLDYINEWSFDWMDGLEELNWCDVRTKLDEEKVIKSLSFLEKYQVFERFGIENDKLKIIDEIYKINLVIGEKLHKWNWIDQNDKNSKMISSDKRWDEIFSELKSQLPIMRKIISYIISLPPSNAFTERLFSMVNHYWTKQKGGLLFQTVRLHFKVRLNLASSCSEMLKILQTDPTLRNSILKKEKYERRFKPRQKSTFDLLSKRLLEIENPLESKKLKVNSTEIVKFPTRTNSSKSTKKSKTNSNQKIILKTAKRKKNELCLEEMMEVVGEYLSKISTKNEHNYCNFFKVPEKRKKIKLQKEEIIIEETLVNDGLITDWVNQFENENVNQNIILESPKRNSLVPITNSTNVSNSEKSIGYNKTHNWRKRIELKMYNSTQITNHEDSTVWKEKTLSMNIPKTKTTSEFIQKVITPKLGSKIRKLRLW